MGSSSSKSNSNYGQTSQATPSAWEQQFDPTLLSLWNNAQPMISGVTGAGGNLAQSILGGQALPGAYSGAGMGLGGGTGSSIYGVGGDAQQNIINQSMRNVPTSLQATGALDSGASQALYQRGAQNVGAQLAQSNVSSLQNAATLGSNLGTAAMQPAFQSASMLTSLLPGLRQQNMTGYQNTQQTYTPSIMSQIQQGLQTAGSIGSLATGMGGLSDSLSKILGQNQGTALSQAGTQAGNQYYPGVSSIMGAGSKF